MATDRLQIVTDIRADDEGIHFQTAEIELPQGARIVQNPEWKTVVGLCSDCPADAPESSRDA